MPRRPSLFAAAASLLLLAAACGTEPPAPAVTTVAIEPAAPRVEVGEALTLTARVRDQDGAAMTGKAVAWTSADAKVAFVAPAAGVLTGIAPGTTTITATVDGRTGTATVVVVPVPVASIAIGNLPAVLIAGQTAALQARTLDRSGNTLAGRVVAWSTSNPAIATVTGDGVVTGVAVGTATITATSEGIAGAATLVVAGPGAAPQIVTLGSGPLVPMTTATIAGANFAADRASNTVTIGGVEATVLSATPTQLAVTVPCVPTGSAEVRVTSSGATSAPATAAITTPQRTVALGQSLVLTNAQQAACTELLTPGGGAARYLVVVFSASVSPASRIDFQLAGNPAAAGAAPRVVTPPATSLAALRDDPEDARDRAHVAHMERDRLEFERGRAIARALPRSALAAQRAPVPTAGETRDFFYTFGRGCGDTTRVIPARAIRVGTRAVIWEDTTNTLRASAEATLQGYYDRLGRIFDEDQYESIRTTFGDPLRRDAETDGDGRVHMVFSQRLNGSGAAAYVSSCDQQPRAVFRGSNHGEVFYGSVPTTATPNLGSIASPDGWFYFMARTVVHEVKHVASIAARFANNAPYEDGWLEEGTARHAEEVWVRQYLHAVPFKGNTGWGSAATNGIYCDFHPEDATCNARDPLRRPGYGVRRQFNEIRDKLVQPWNWSPYGDDAGQTGSVFYQTAWSLVRYAIDRYGASDAAFLRALVDARATGSLNLAAVAGVPLDQLIGGWGLALYADDYPGLANPSRDLQFATWDLRSIYAGLNADPAWTGRWSTPYPVRPTALGFGAFTTTQAGLRGGAHAYYELSGAAAPSQLLALRNATGGTPSTQLRIAIARLQ